MDGELAKESLPSTRLAQRDARPRLARIARKAELSLQRREFRSCGQRGHVRVVLAVRLLVGSGYDRASLRTANRDTPDLSSVMRSRP